MTARNTTRKVVDSALRREWAQDVIGGRRTEAQIAKQQHVDIRTVRKHVSRGRDELAFDQARARVFEDALRSHFAHLTDLAGRLRQRVEQPDSLGRPLVEETDWSSQRLLGALKQHLPRTPLWGRLTEWNELTIQRLSDVRDRVKQRAAQTVGEGAEGLRQLLAYHADAFILTGSGLDGRGRQVTAAEDETLLYGAFRWPMGDSTRGKSIEKRVEAEERRAKELEDAVLNWPEVDEGRTLIIRLNQLRRDLGSELETIVLRQILPGVCTYCPGSQDSSRPKGRKSA
jgi:hypothetical protein